MKTIFNFLIIAWLMILTFGVLYLDGQSIHRDTQIMDKILVLQENIITNSHAMVTNQMAILDLYKRLGVTESKQP